MSWGFNVEEEKKEYPVAGTVTISSEEYRDLISRNAELKIKAQREHDDWYEQQNKVNDLEKKIKECTAVYEDVARKCNLYFEFVRQNDLLDEFKEFCRLVKLEEMEDEE